MRILNSSELELVAGGLIPVLGGDDGGGYADGLPDIDFSIDPIDIGGLDVSFTFDPAVSQVNCITTVDDSAVEHAVLTPEVADAIGNAASAACGMYAKKFSGAMICSGLGSAVSAGLSRWTASRQDKQEFFKGMEYGSRFGLMP